MASSGLGIVNYLDLYHSRLMNAASTSRYGRSIGEIIQGGAQKMFEDVGQEDFFARTTYEQTSLHGDPAVRLTVSASKPDYAIEPAYVKVTPSFISVAETSFKVQATFHNLGKAIAPKTVIEVRRTYPDQSSAVILRDSINGIPFSDTVTYTIPIVSARDKGQNRIEICIDPFNTVEEIFETNNCAAQDFVIYEDEARPVWPMNYSIVTSRNIKLTASTANPLAPSQQYRMELDTTALFNSPLTYRQTLNASGGILEFMPGLTFQDSVVYYWRVAPVTPGAPMNWNTASFVYIQNGPSGFQQSHFYQHTQSTPVKMQLDSTNRAFRFDRLPRLFLSLIHI